jgi:benzoyl-CoA reductase/2-hydroxyglutaryl-CoA dehydratase subunit BcrC/BadD/HgdB
MAKLFATNSAFMDMGPRVHVIEKAARIWKVDGILWWVHANCRTYATDALMIKDALEKRLKIPVCFIEGDVYDPRIYNVQQQRIRMETFAEMVKMSKMKKEREQGKA